MNGEGVEHGAQHEDRKTTRCVLQCMPLMTAIGTKEV
jgi:hypothetical protein